MTVILTRIRDGAEFLGRYQAAFPEGGLFVPTRRMLPPGEAVILDIRMPLLSDSMLIGGKVVWSRRGQRKRGLRAGLGVEFLAGEHYKRDYLLALARGTDRRGVKARRHKRLPVELEGSWRVARDSERHTCKVNEIGQGGAFLCTPKLMPRGAPVLLDLVAPGSLGVQTIEGRVAWSRDTPGAEGFGLEFRCRDIVGKQRLRELVRRLSD